MKNDAKNENFTKGTKPIVKTISICLNGSDARGNNYNVASAEELLNDLQTSGVFDKLSVFATMSKSLCYDNTDYRGVISVARIKSVNAKNHEITLVFFGKNTEFASVLENNPTMVMPRMRIDRDSNDVTTFFGFDIVLSTLKPVE